MVAGGDGFAGFTTGGGTKIDVSKERMNAAKRQFPIAETPSGPGFARSNVHHNHNNHNNINDASNTKEKLGTLEELDLWDLVLDQVEVATK